MPIGKAIVGTGNNSFPATILIVETKIQHIYNSPKTAGHILRQISEIFFSASDTFSNFNSNCPI